MAIDFGNILNTLKDGIINLAKTNLQDYVQQASQDGQALLNGMKDDLQTWTQQLAAGQITADDLKFNVLGQADILQMAALKDAGLAAVRVDQFKADVLNLVVNTITALI